MTSCMLLLIGLDRDKLITLAFLLGSDYTEGLEGNSAFRLVG